MKKSIFTKALFIIALAALAVFPLMSASAQSGGPSASMQREGISILSVGGEEIQVGDTVTYSIWLHSLPAGVTGGEAICTFNDTYVDLSNVETLFLPGETYGIFGEDAIVATNQETGKLTYAIASVPPNTAESEGGVFSFDLTGVSAGTFTFNCTVRIAIGTTLTTVSFTPLSITVTEPSTNGNVIGTILDNDSVYDGTKTVTINLTDGGSVNENDTVDLGIGGDFSFSVPAGHYTISASLNGYMDAIGEIDVVAGDTIEMSDLDMIAGDIVKDNIIDPLDVASIGANYNKTTPTAADLNGSGLINLLDLQLLAPNYNLTGPYLWTVVP